MSPTTIKSGKIMGTELSGRVRAVDFEIFLKLFLVLRSYELGICVFWESPLMV
jgi:hypothetical protein